MRKNQDGGHNVIEMCDTNYKMDGASITMAAIITFLTITSKHPHHVFIFSCKTARQIRSYSVLLYCRGVLGEHLILVQTGRCSIDKTVTNEHLLCVRKLYHRFRMLHFSPFGFGTPLNHSIRELVGFLIRIVYGEEGELHPSFSLKICQIGEK